MRLNAHIIKEEAPELALHGVFRDSLELDIRSARVLRKGVRIERGIIYIAVASGSRDVIQKNPAASWLCLNECGSGLEDTVRKAGGNLLISETSKSPNEICELLERLFDRLDSWDERICEAIIANDVYIPTVSSIAIEILKNPLLVINSSGMLSHGEGALPADFDAPTWLAIQNREQNPSLMKKAWLSPTGTIEDPLILPARDGSPYHVVGFDISAMEERQLRVYFADCNKPFTKGFFSVVRRLLTLIELATRKRLSAEQVGTGQENYLIQMLSGNNPDPVLLNAQFEIIGWKPHEDKFLIVIRNVVAQGDSYVGDFPREALKRTFPRAIVFRFAENTIALCPTFAYEYRITALAKTLQSITDQRTQQCAVSDVFFNAMHLNKHYQQCLSTMRFSDYGNVSFFALHRFDYFAKETGVDECAPNLIHPMVMKLFEYDQENGTDLISTLSGYLKTGGNKAELAKLQHVHYNTLCYRLNRIQEICHIDFKDPRQLSPQTFHLILSCELITRNIASSADGKYRGHHT